MKFRILYIVLFMAIAGHAQLPTFTLDIEPINMTCNSNGGVTLTPGNLTPLAILNYKIYKLPNIATPIAAFTNNTYIGLDVGDYKVRAEQVLGTDASPPIELQFTITNVFEETVMSVAQLPPGSCDQSGTVVVTVSQGSGPFFYQVITDGVPGTPQSSNILTDVTEGEHNIRVFDVCGNGAVKTITVLLTANDLSISSTAVPPIATSCATMTLNNEVTPNSGNIYYPVKATYTVHFPSGNQVIEQLHATGPPDSLSLELQVPVQNTPFTYDLVVSDDCGHFFSTFDNDINPNPEVAINETPNECGDKFITVTVANVMPPYTMVFDTFPANFDPGALNPAYMGPLNGDTLSLTFGSDTNPVPEGIYHVTVSDSCGRIAGADKEVKKEELHPDVTIVEATCTTPARIQIKLQQTPRKIKTVIVTVAPPEYAATHPLPFNASPAQPQETVTIINASTGHYEISLIDICDVPYTAQAEVQPFSGQSRLQVNARASCDEGLGSLRVRSPNGGGLVTLTMISAPPEFGATMPLDLSGSLSNGSYFNPALAAGFYDFVGTDACGATLTLQSPIEVIGYDNGVNNFNVDPNCGTFNLSLHDHANITGSYWLQKKNPTTGLYEHPDTGVVYPDQTVPTSDNSIQLTNNETMYNIDNTGTFRIVKIYQSFSDVGSVICPKYYDDFVFTGDLKILKSYSLDCEDGEGPGSVFVDVVGVPPYTYRITEKNGQPFVVENGTDAIFQGLEPALYEIEVEDSCNRIETTTVNVATLLPLVHATTPGTNGGPGEQLYCSNSNETSHPFDLTAFNSEILGNQPADLYTISYHLSEADVRTGANPITSDVTQYVNTSNPQTIWARVVHNSISLCYDYTSFPLFVGTEPTLTLLPDIYLCEGDEQHVLADYGFDAYEWSTGDTTRGITIDTPGTYTVTVKNAYGGSFCEATQTITVTNTESAHIDSIDITDWTDDDNSFTMHVSGDGDYVFSIDRQNYQADPTFTGLEPGIYTVDVKDLHGCPGVSKEVLILNYPKFFTPNGDGYNDKWKIKNSVFEPGMMTYIFDRYGKLITGLEHDSPGWDGTYNGQPLPSTDYWFMVQRVDGKVHRGHFAMKR
ncbi:T9SS type B sorting domain-containing protein [Flavobacterium pallidum]|uniref:T9SS type B sorting domain-containing protein n=1 Tax=Flavobacterium pallidum TaxID=2172098 RepID=A0A2S1SGK4_9FLAO|nr:T9SS type B sorting domain-containing protein [Flavobacterium pallidum]AWI25546.1 hypothetical protein HYN49_06360 [Flavobacterium pallidum]